LALELTKDPLSTFGNLMTGCISDDYQERDRGLTLEGILFLTLGVCASVVTTYVLSLAGILL